MLMRGRRSSRRRIAFSIALRGGVLGRGGGRGLWMLRRLGFCLLCCKLEQDVDREAERRGEWWVDGKMTALNENGRGTTCLPGKRWRLGRRLGPLVRRRRGGRRSVVEGLPLRESLGSVLLTNRVYGSRANTSTTSSSSCPTSVELLALAELLREHQPESLLLNHASTTAVFLHSSFICQRIDA
jgi:hypothetical protein